MGALFLSSKLEECVVRMTYLITVYDMLIRRARNESTEIPLDAFSQVTNIVLDALINHQRAGYVNVAWI